MDGRHLIDNLQFENLQGQSIPNHLARPDWPSVCRDNLLPIIDRVFDEFSPDSNYIHRLELLEIDLGVMSASLSIEEIEERFERALRDQLRQCFFEDPFQSPQSPGQVSVISRTTAEQNHLEHYLRKGYLPARANSDQDYSLGENLIAFVERDVDAALSLLLADHRHLERTIRQLNDDELEKLLRNFAVNDKSSPLPWRLPQSSLESRTGLVQSDDLDRRHKEWEQIFLQILDLSRGQGQYPEASFEASDTPIVQAEEVSALSHADPGPTKPRNHQPNAASIQDPSSDLELDLRSTNRPAGISKRDPDEKTTPTEALINSSSPGSSGNRHSSHSPEDSEQPIHIVSGGGPSDERPVDTLPMEPSVDGASHGSDLQASSLRIESANRMPTELDWPDSAPLQRFEAPSDGDVKELKTASHLSPLRDEHLINTDARIPDDPSASYLPDQASNNKSLERLESGHPEKPHPTKAHTNPSPGVQGSPSAEPLTKDLEGNALHTARVLRRASPASAIYTTQARCALLHPLAPDLDDFLEGPSDPDYINPKRPKARENSPQRPNTESTTQLPNQAWIKELLLINSDALNQVVTPLLSQTETVLLAMDSWSEDMLKRVFSRLHPHEFETWWPFAVIMTDNCVWEKSELRKRRLWSFLAQALFPKPRYQTTPEFVSAYARSISGNAPHQADFINAFCSSLPKGPDVDRLVSYLRYWLRNGMKQELPPVPQTSRSGIPISNAGQVIPSVYFPLLFDRLGLLEEGLFPKPAYARRACYLLQFMVYGHCEASEHQFVLNKLLCGLDSRQPLDAAISLKASEESAIEDMLTACIGHWSALGNTSIAGLRETFLQRDGVLTKSDDAWQLKVEKKTLDILMERLPWGFSVIRHPWMAQPIYVEWL